jgi:hypothetical protein
VSDTTEADAQAAAATEPSATETQTAPQPETRTEDAAPGAETTDPKPEDKPADPPKPTPDPRDRAIRQLAFEQRETRRQLAAAREQLQLVQPRDPNAPPSQADLDRQVEQRAAAMLEARESQAKSEAWIAKGNAEFPDFTERCNELANMGAGENPAFMTAINRLPDGHKVIAELAANPADTARILQLGPVDLAIELASMAHRIAATPPPPPKPTTQAPPPIRPLPTQARAEVRLENLDGAAFRSAFLKQFNSG